MFQAGDSVPIRWVFNEHRSEEWRSGTHFAFPMFVRLPTRGGGSAARLCARRRGRDSLDEVAEVEDRDERDDPQICSDGVGCERRQHASRSITLRLASAQNAERDGTHQGARGARAPRHRSNGRRAV
jgi:hypothetical protein